MVEIQSPHEFYRKMKTWRDEFKLKSHLLRVEIKDEWEKIDAKANGAKEEVKRGARKLAHQLHERYSKIKRTFTEGAQ